MTTQSMMTDMTPTADPPCGRRAWIVTPDSKRFVCKPPSKLPDLPAAELLKRPGLFRTRDVGSAHCKVCSYQEPVVVLPPSKESSEQHQVDGAASAAVIVGRTPIIVPPNPDPDPPRTSQISDDGTIIYQKEGWEPPPVPPGYRRQSDDLSSTDAWVLVRETPLCKHVVLHQAVEKSCGCTSVIYVCTHRGKAENISGTKCDSCPHQEARDA